MTASHPTEPPAGTFFAAPELRRTDRGIVEWFTPTEFARGPWDPEACHAGPPTALLVRALERAVPEHRLVRVTVDLGKPVPLAGFAVVAEATRSGRSVGAARAEIIDGDGTVRATATGLHIGAAEPPLFAGQLDNSGFAPPRLSDAVPGPFTISEGIMPFGFGTAVAMRYPADVRPGPGASTVWMRTVGVLPGEEASPFQRICPLADCGNAFSRHAEPDRFGFVNADLTIALHRDPVGDWFGMRSTSQWQPHGAGVVTSTLFDDHGVVGTALQTLLLRPRHG